MYLGIGPSAHGYNGKERRFNVANNAAYMKGLENATEYYDFEILTAEDRFNETLMTGLRTKWGVNLDVLNQFKCTPNDFQSRVKQYEIDGLMFEKEGFLILTEKGFLLADYLASELFCT